MDAVKFAIYRKRYCDSHHCDTCPIYEECDNEENPRAAAKIVKVVEKWAKEHPIKTRATVFFEQYPSASKNTYGYPEISPCMLDKRYKCKRDSGCCGTECLKCREEYWRAEIE